VTYSCGYGVCAHIAATIAGNGFFFRQGLRRPFAAAGKGGTGVDPGLPIQTTQPDSYTFFPNFQCRGNCAKASRCSSFMRTADVCCSSAQQRGARIGIQTAGSEDTYAGWNQIANGNHDAYQAVNSFADFAGTNALRSAG
jgi:hypothetical protein